MSAITQILMESLQQPLDALADDPLDPRRQGLARAEVYAGERAPERRQRFHRRADDDRLAVAGAALDPADAVPLRDELIARLRGLEDPAGLLTDLENPWLGILVGTIFTALLVLLPQAWQVMQGATLLWRHDWLPAAGLSLEAANSYAQLVGIASTQDAGVQRVNPGNPDMSYLITKLEGPGAAGGQMPPSGPLAQADIDVIRQWITDGTLLR